MELTNFKKIRFITIGYIEWRKGQDILIDAIEEIPKNFLEKCEIIIVGQDNSSMARVLKERIKTIPWVNILGPVDRNTIHDLLKESDVIICPSREDPMPTVCTEAMMHHVPCLVSDSTGTADYISNGKDGIIFKNQDVNDLKEKILWCINNRDYLNYLGENAYNVYLNHFSEKVFEEKLLTCVKEMIN